MDTTSTVRVVIEGEPVGKERPRSGQGRHYTPAKTVAAEDAVKMILRAGGCRRPLEGELCLTMSFHLAGQRDRRRRDGDNMQKLVQDACNGIAWKDDSQVVEWHGRLVYGDPRPRTELEIRPITAELPDPTNLDWRGTPSPLRCEAKA